jgi:hypothetical protein
MTASVQALREIILDDENNSLRTRMQAAEQILLFEAPADATELAKAFLTEVFEDSEAHINTRMEALKFMRKAEARRAQPGAQGSTSEAERRAAWRKELMWQRQSSLVKAGLFPLPPGWADDLKSPDFVPPDGEPPRLDTNGLAEKMVVARQEFYESREAGVKSDEPEGP